MPQSSQEILQQIKENNSKFTEVIFESGEINDAHAFELGQALQQNTVITTLLLRNNLISPSGAKAIAEGLKFNGNIRLIDLSENQVDDEGVFHFKKTLKKLFAIDFQANYIGDQGIKHIIEALKSRQDYPSLFSLTVSQNPIGDNGIKFISGNLELFYELELKDTSMTTRGVKYLCNALKTNATLTLLDLTACALGEEGAFLLGEALKVNRKLNTLILTNNGVGEGVKLIGEALKINKTLTTLILSNNVIGKGIKHIVDALKINISLLNLSIESNGGRFDEEEKSIKKSLENNRDIKNEENYITKANLIGKKTGKFSAPSLLKIGLFNIYKNFKSPAHIQQIEEKLPNVLKDTLKRLGEDSCFKASLKNKKAIKN